MDADLLETLPLSHRLALSYAPKAVQPSTLALLALETRLSGILRQQGETIIAQMKLAWWRDRFAQSPDEWPLGEPLLALFRQWPGDTRALGRIVDGWEVLIGETLDQFSIGEFAAGRASGWRALAGSLAERAIEPVSAAARQFALADLAMHLDQGEERELVVEALAQERASKLPRLPREARSLAVLRALTLRALDRDKSEVLDSPGAMLTAMRVGISGR